MKRIILSLFAISLLLNSCTTEEIVDVQNNTFLGQSFERTINLNNSNNFQQTVVVPDDVEIFESDMVLSYILIDEVDGFDVWQLLPQIFYTAGGEEFQYNFEHNFDEITLFIDAPTTFNLNTLLPGDTNNLTFRVVVLPIEFINSNNIDITNYNDVIEFVQ